MEHENGRIDSMMELILEQQSVMKQMGDATNLQSRCFDGQEMDEIRFDRLQQQKDDSIIRLGQLSEQFDQLMPNVREELLRLIRTNAPIALALQRESNQLREMSVQLQRAEANVKSLFEKYIKGQRNEINLRRKQAKSAANYMKSMLNQYDNTSYFYDKKN